MSIATELQDLNDNILDAYTAIGNKGGTVPAQKNTANLDTAIGSIPAAPEAYIPLAVNAISNTLEKPTTSFTWSAPSSASIIGDYALRFAFSRSGITSVDLSNVTTINMYGLQYAFQSCTSLTSVDLSNVTTINKLGLQYAFNDCTSLTSVDLSNVTTVDIYGLNYAFYGCTSLTSVDLSNLVTVNANTLDSAFQGCTGLTTMSFDDLSSIGPSGFQYAFRNCTNLTSLSFPALTTSSFGSLTNQFSSMLRGCSGVTVHFPAAIQSTIGSWSDVTSGFGGTNTTVLFDL